MTGNELKDSIKKMKLTQAEAAEKLGITRATFNNWCKLATLSPVAAASIESVFGIKANQEYDNNVLLATIHSQQRTIEELTSIIKNLTSKNQ